MTAPLEIIESGFRVSAPRPAFRFADCPHYRSLSGKNLKEMDVGWQEVGPNKRARLIVLELKGIGVWATKPDDPVKPHEHLVKTCVAKELLLAVGEAVNGLLAGRAATAGVRWVSVIDFEGAQKLGLPVTRAP